MRTKRQIKESLKLKTAAPPLTEGNGRICMAEGCMCDAPYPAPRNRSELRSYIWFCLDHIRHYNSSWNYYDGIEGAAMEEEIRRATTWERPSWKFGTGPSAAAASSPDTDMAEVKKRYNELAKSLHPDHNRDDPKAEEKLKEINLAYSVLRKNAMKEKI
ncbi:MAG: molecular chaperone DnaJ [Proteobacteria bacterium]|nr:molecular chaperone DnaJ [Pseudomonadota bacterium]